MVPLIARIGLGLLFIVSGSLKLRHSGDLAATITGLHLGLPGPLVAAIAVALPPFEILLGIYLATGLLLFVASTVAAVLLLIFIAVLSSAVLRGLSAPCGCFGPGDNAPTTWLTVLRDGAAIIPALYLMWWSSRQRDRS
ncbi:MAG: DoxX family membrane protein [Candidatus Eremiobacteraeota bacterium]|nr:DoxX family membrane protein [Candidatus Eremiobacteraeota bacterium]